MTHRLFLLITCILIVCGTARAYDVSAAPAQQEPVVVFGVEDSDMTVTVPQKDFVEWFVVDTGLMYDPLYKSTIENTKNAPRGLCPTEHPGCLYLTATRMHRHAHNTQHVAIRFADVERFVGRLAETFDRDAQDARFHMDDGRVTVFTPSRDGILVDRAATVARVVAEQQAILTGMLPKAIIVPTKRTAPKVTIDAINSLGLTEIIGEGRSNFAGSPTNRMHNIRTAAAKMEGMIIAPGEEFSFGTVLGDVDETTGYRQELVIKDHQTKPEYGGGICQVSSTVFRAAIYAGLEVTERRNHSYPVKYYQPIGFDATTYGTHPDLKIRNNTTHHILLHNFIEGTELIFQIYGTPDGRHVEMKGPFVTEKKPDGSMKTYFTQKVTDKSGAVIIDDVFTSNYKSPNDYPHPGDVSRAIVFTSKPEDWSKKQWEEYQKTQQ